MAKKTIVKQDIEAEIRRMSRKGAKLHIIRGRIDLSRRSYRNDPAALKILDALEMEYVIKPLGGMPYGEASAR